MATAADDANRPLLQDYEHSAVPAGQYRGYVSLTLVFVGVCIGIPPLLLGSKLVAGMGMKNAASAILWSSLIATPICLLASHVGLRSRLSTAMTLKYAFGSVGAKVISTIIAVDMFGWFAVNTEIFGESLHSTVRMVLKITLSTPALSVVAGVALTIVTIFGYRSVEKLAFLVVPLLSAVLVAYFVYSLVTTSFAVAMARPPLGQRIAYATAISIVTGSYLNLSVLLPDYTRYAKSGWHAAVAVVVGLCLGLPLVVLIACYLTAATGEADFVKLMLIRGWGLAAIFVIAVTCWIHMNSCLYSASLNLSAIIRRVPKWQLTIVGGVAGTMVAVAGIVERYVSFLTLLSIIVPPISGVYTADYLLRRKTYESNEPDLVDRVRPVSIAALLAGIALGFVTSPRDALGFGVVSLTRLPAIDAFAGAFVFRALLEIFAVAVNRNRAGSKPEQGAEPA